MTTKNDALAAIEGLKLSDCLAFFDSKATARDKQICEIADWPGPVDNDGHVERDNYQVSEGDDNGAVVVTWTWVSFEGTVLDKDEEEDEEDE